MKNSLSTSNRTEDCHYESRTNDEISGRPYLRPVHSYRLVGQPGFEIITFQHFKNVPRSPQGHRKAARFPGDRWNAFQLPVPHL